MASSSGASTKAEATQSHLLEIVNGAFDECARAHEALQRKVLKTIAFAFDRECDAFHPKVEARPQRPEAIVPQLALQKLRPMNSVLYSVGEPSAKLNGKPADWVGCEKVVNIADISMATRHAAAATDKKGSSENGQPTRPPYCNGCDAPHFAGFPALSGNDTSHDSLMQILSQNFHQQQLEQRSWIESTLASTLKEFMETRKPALPATANSPRLNQAVAAQRNKLNRAQSTTSVLGKFWDRYDDDSHSSVASPGLAKPQEPESPRRAGGMSPQRTESTLSRHFVSESQISDVSKDKGNKFKHRRTFTVESLAAKLAATDDMKKNGLQAVFQEHGYKLCDVIEDIANGTNPENKRIHLSWRAFCRATFPVRTIVESMMGLLVVLDCAAIGIKGGHEQDNAHWLIWDGFVALVFFVERTVIVLLTGCRSHYFGSGARWNIFETMLVLLMIAELALQAFLSENVNESLLTLLRLLRLGRFVRILRLSRLRIFSDLLMLLTGAAGGLKTLCWSILLISVPIYMVSLVLTGSLAPPEDKDNDPSRYFSNLPLSFFTMFRCVVAQECTDDRGQPIFLLLTSTYGWQYGLLYCITHLLMTFGLFNVIVAIYVENTVAAAKTNETQKRRARLMDNRYFTKKTKEMVEFVYRVLVKGEGFEGTDPKEDGISGELCFAEKLKLEITPDGFAELRQFKEFQDLLRDLDIADESQLDFFKTLDVDGGGTIDLEELVAGLTLLRGDARRSDIVGVALVVRSMQATLNHFEIATTQQLKAHTEQLRSLKKFMQAGRDSLVEKQLTSKSKASGASAAAR